MKIGQIITSRPAPKTLTKSWRWSRRQGYSISSFNLSRCANKGLGFKLLHVLITCKYLLMKILIQFFFTKSTKKKHLDHHIMFLDFVSCRISVLRSIQFHNTSKSYHSWDHSDFRPNVLICVEVLQEAKEVHSQCQAVQHADPDKVLPIQQKPQNDRGKKEKV